MIYWLHIRLINLFFYSIIVPTYYYSLLASFSFHSIASFSILPSSFSIHFTASFLLFFFYSSHRFLVEWDSFVKRLSFEAETFSFSKKKFLSSFCVFVRPLQTNFQLVEVAGKPKTFHIGPQTKSASPISFGSFISSV